MKNSKTVKYLLGIIFLLSNVNGIGQSTDRPANLPQVIPPSPNAWIFQKFTDVPVSYYNGLPEINVPIYSIKAGKYEYPISLSYHAGGIRTEDKASWVGLNWVLNGVGMISRTVMDYADDVTYGFRYNSYDPDTLQSDLAEQHLHEQLMFWIDRKTYGYDLQPDMFYLNVAGISTKFYIDKQGNVVQINKTDNTITPVFEGNPPNETYGTLKAFTVVGADGTKYFFGNGLDEKMVVDNMNPEEPLRYQNYRSAWFLEKLITMNNDTVRFEYESDNTRYYSTPLTQLTIKSDQMNWWVPLIGGSPAECPQVPQYSTSVTDNSVFGNRLRRIIFDQGSVEFYASARQDTDAGNKKLDSIKVYNYLGRMIAGYKMQYDYYSDVYTGLYSFPLNPNIYDTYKRLRLLSITSFDSLSEMPPYLFEYSNNTLPLKSSTAIDHWGYYNASNGNRFNMPYFLPVFGTGYASPLHPLITEAQSYRMSTDSMMRGTLFKVTYPTGGYTQMDFEANEVFMPNFVHNINFDQEPHLFPPSHTEYSSYPGTFQLQEVNAIPDTAQTAESITVTNQNSLDEFSISSQCGFRYFQITSINCPDYNTSNLRLKIDIFPTTYSFYCKSPNDIDSRFYLLPDGQYQFQINLVDEMGLPVGTINDPVSVTMDIKADILDFCQLKNRKVGGLRIKSMDIHDPVNQLSIHKEYRYRDAIYPDRSSGYLTNKPIYFNSNRRFVGSWFNFDPRFWCGALEFSEKSHIGDSKTGGNVVGYNHVEEIFGENGSQGKIIYEYLSPKEIFDDLAFDLDKYPFPPVASYDWARGQLINKKIFKNSSTNGYQLLQTDSSVYDLNIALPAIEGVALGNNWWSNFDIETEYPGTDPLPDGYCWLNIKEYDIPHGAVRLSAQYHTDFDPQTGSKLEQIQKYFYDNALHVQPSRTETYDSKGNLIKTENKYPYDFSGTAVYDTMIARNIINPLVDQVRSNVSLNKELSHTKNNFGFWHNMLRINLETVQTSIQGNALETEVAFNKYDPYGNIHQFTSRKGVTSYIWDYKSQYPIAQVVNADSSQIAYTSFEADGSGNWTISSVLRSPDGITGSKCYELSNGNISRNNLSNTMEYIVSYWRKNGTAISIAGTIGNPTQGLTVDGWTCYIHRVTGVSQLTFAGGGLIDELRLYPNGTQMTTYTYSPLIGMTSQCDAADKITYYEYDSFGRLKLARDHDKNILKKFDYKYQADTNQ